MNKYKKLINNSIIFVIGNFGSKVINLLMVPLYTYVLTTGEYGTVDLLTTTISLLVPVLSCSIDEAVLRFVMLDKIEDEQRSGIFTTAILLNVASQILFILIVFPLLRLTHVLEGLLIPFLILLLLSQLQTTLAQFTRGVGKVKLFALNGILMTFITASLNVLLLVIFDFKIEGYVWSLIIANLVSVVFLFIASGGIYDFSPRNIDRVVVKKMLMYSVPLIPNMVIWWVITGSTRYFILFFLGASVNGLFAVANKIPSILSIFTTVFQQAWQLSAFEEYNSQKSKAFFSNVFQYYYQFLFMGCSLIYMFLKTVIPSVIGSSFKDSWLIMPLLLFAVLYQSFSSFIGTNYTAALKTKGVFTSSIIGGVVSIVCNLIFIPLFGVIGTGVGTLISFFVTFIYRYFDTKRFFDFQLNLAKFTVNNLLVVIQALLLYGVDDLSIMWISQISCFLLLVLINKDSFISIFKAVSSRKRKI